MTEGYQMTEIEQSIVGQYEAQLAELDRQYAALDRRWQGLDTLRGAFVLGTGRNRSANIEKQTQLAVKMQQLRTSREMLTNQIDFIRSGKSAAREKAQQDLKALLMRQASAARKAEREWRKSFSSST